MTSRAGTSKTMPNRPVSPPLNEHPPTNEDSARTNRPKVPNVITLIASINRWLKTYASRLLPVYRVTFNLPRPLPPYALQLFQDYGSVEYIFRYQNRPSQLIINMAPREQTVTAHKVEIEIRRQLYEGGNFYWGAMLPLGERGMEAWGGQEVLVAEGKKEPDGSLYIPSLQSPPLMVIEVGIGDSFWRVYDECRMWLKQPGRPIRYAILVKINRWPRKQPGTKIMSYKRGTLGDFERPAGIEGLKIELDRDLEADETGNPPDDDPRRRTHKFHSVTVSVFGSAGKESHSPPPPIINQMEVWPATPARTWEFTWAEMAPGIVSVPEEIKHAKNVISFQFLHDLFEQQMVGKRALPNQSNGVELDQPQPSSESRS
ncbi:hypothetical protein FN846DRAFT_910346 [Sphaerosporella brunnea]|uniref:Uncharacterized protein n=1 Tax=Sphaerosporella brunnea TaxID=1250544 RepID=A0A5J5ENG9_9PEZI|nr:hypothetical protein FN846DRAFT_910346 [Sphaerosporella brunnea]